MSISTTDRTYLTMERHPRHESSELTNILTSAIQTSMRCVAPLWPITTFAARSPWLGLESNAFHDVAKWLKAQHDVDMYPNEKVIQQAITSGQIDVNLADRHLKHWLDGRFNHISTDEAWTYCWHALRQPDVANLSVSSDTHRVVADLLKASHSAAKRVHGCDGPRSLRTVHTASKTVQGVGLAPVADELNRHIIKWCKLYLGESAAPWHLPLRERGLFGAWRELVELDTSLQRHIRRQLAAYPSRPDEALITALTVLDIGPSDWPGYLSAHMLELSGWAGMLRYQGQQVGQEDSHIMDYLALRIVLEATLVQPYLNTLKNVTEVPEATFDTALSVERWRRFAHFKSTAWARLSHEEQVDRLMLSHEFNSLEKRKIWLEAWEETQSRKLGRNLESSTIARKKLLSNASEDVQHKDIPAAQLIFCIDVRSEPFRRQLEASGSFETFGMAGFFGLPISAKYLDSDVPHPALPVILKPQYSVSEVAHPSAIATYTQRQNIVDNVVRSFKEMKQDPAANLLLPELTGAWLATSAIARSVLPTMGTNLLKRLSAAWLQKPKTHVNLEQPHGSLDTNVSDSRVNESDKVALAHRALLTIGLTRRFAPLVVFCGHGSESENNPYAAKLDCGACGGVSGALNARVIASILNDTSIRKALADKGISIPEQTVFAAAEHVTTRDELNFVYLPELSPNAQISYGQICTALQMVSTTVAERRVARLPNAHRGTHSAVQSGRRFASDWSEVRPEWGLARNCAFVIGRRTLTESIDLDGQVFLHSYDPDADPDARILQGILAGPGTVTQWINLQYYACAVDPSYFGSGSKTTQTVTAGIGVMQGNGSDLLSGLPWQSLMINEDELYHTPLRLIIVIEAPRERVFQILKQNERFRQKVAGGWLRLAVFDERSGYEPIEALTAQSVD